MNIDFATGFSIVQTAALFCGGLLLLFKAGRATGKLEEAIKLQNIILKNQAEDVTELKVDVKKFSEVLGLMAVQDHRLERVEQDIREIKNGRGFVGGVK